MKKQIALAVALAGAVPCASNASAAVIVNDYTVVANGMGGPISSVTLNFRLTYDPALPSSDLPVISYSSSSINASFNPVGGVGFNYDPGTSQFQVGGKLNGPRLTAVGTNDFFVGFLDNGSTIGFPVVGYTTQANTASNYFTFNVQVARSAAAVGGVPEPATWAMMLLGFGFVGGAMRSAKRRQRRTVSYA